MSGCTESIELQGQFNVIAHTRQINFGNLLTNSSSIYFVYVVAETQKGKNNR